MSETTVAPPPRRPRTAALRVVTVALLVLAGLGLAAWGGRHAWAWHHFRAGRAALEADDLDAARSHLDSCLRAWGRSTEARLLAARAARRADDLEAAERHLDEHERRGGDAEARAFEWAMLHTQRGEFADTETYLRNKVAGSEGRDALLGLEALGKGYAATGRMPDALRSLDELLRRQPDHFQAHLLRGRVISEMGELPEALADYDAAVAARPSSFEARLRRAALLERLGRLADAVAEYEALRLARPDDPEVLLGLARLRADSHELEKADALLGQLLAAHPDRTDALLERARVGLRRGEAGRAEEWAREATRRAPGDRDAFSVLALALEAQQGKEDDARRCRARIDEIDADRDRVMRLGDRAREEPGNLTLRFEIAAALLRLGRTEQGVRGLEGVLAADPNHPGAHAALADYYERTGQPDKAKAHRRP
ncbi:MAG TPA: tetratricopeptide repeat protein [Gemmataceae bacterium]|nr:tetratricopeptide repeat protein [Gemmataceae bacterium]